MNDQNINKKRNSARYILNFVLLIIIFAILIFGFMDNLIQLSIQFKLDIDPISIAILAGVLILSWLGVVNLQKEDLDSNITGILIFTIIFFSITSGIIMW